MRSSAAPAGVGRVSTSTPAALGATVLSAILLLATPADAHAQETERDGHAAHER